MSTTERRRGLFLTFEGMDGCGKTTQMRLLAERLRRAGYDVVETVEPGGTAVGQQIRRILLDSTNREICPTAELLLYFASRAQNIEQVILPSLRAGKLVLSDRFTDSTLAYQGAGRRLGEEVVRQLEQIACGGLKPDLTVLLDIDLETSLARARARNLTEPRAGTRMDEQGAEFYQRVREAYRRLAEREPERFVVVDGRGEPEDVAEAVWAALTARLPELHV
ncbi:MAG: dTMP kinase [Bryobacterales bacterium]|nr:dTMP kinase [Bryobacteraceae bacterium]MDW8355737.1 dTMP kinase [Bryobacterales bacterium]